MKSKDQVLLEQAYQKVSEDYRLMKGEPSINPPEYYDSPDLECPVCGGPMYDEIERTSHFGKSDKWEWDYRCEDENCDGAIYGDNLP